MTDTSTSTSNTWKVTQGVVLIVLLTLATFVAAGLGWHAGVALARVLGL